MERILGLDVGVSSIGSGLLELEEGRGRIVFTGVRIINQPVDNDLKTNASERRLARSMRTTTRRRAERKRELKEILLQEGMMPGPAEQAAWLNLNPYALRKEALERTLSPFELGRVFLHLAQRRGFLPNVRGAVLAQQRIPEVISLTAELNSIIEARESELAAKRKDLGPVREDIERTRTELQASGAQSLGSFLYGRLSPLERVRGRYLHRNEYRDEFDLIWSRQAADNPSLLTESLQVRIYRCLFFQRLANSRPQRRADCRYEKNRRVTSKGHFLFQRFVALQALRNLRFTPKNGDEDRLNEEQFGTLYARLKEKGELKWSEVRKMLAWPASTIINLEDRSQKTPDPLRGCHTDMILDQATEGAWSAMPAEVQEKAMTALLIAEGDLAVLRSLTEQAGIERLMALRLMSADIKTGVGSLSVKALKKLVPLLESGHTLSQAELELGDRSGGEAAPPRPARNELTFEDDPETNNPTVRKICAEVRKLVNALIKQHGRPDIIRIELGKEMSMGPEDLARFNQGRNQAKKVNDEAVKEMKAQGIADSPWNRKKYRLFKECNAQCPYTGESIQISELWTGKWQVEHIIPRNLLPVYADKYVTLAS
ncbi:MAG: hypothetical protein MH204_02120, partial [Fimbriimonadaceae bacterium]|nr:hypothetical protein [Fimbriimonadaceae bacterium]